MIKLAESVKKMRTIRGLTQVQVAEALNIARSSYIAIEKGSRDVTLTEAEQLARTLGVTVEEIYKRVAPDHNKYRQMILFFLRSVPGDGKVPKTKLAKYLYLADFAWFYSNLESMSGMAYRRISFGPVPDQFFRAIDELESEGLLKIQYKVQNGSDVHLISVTDAGRKMKLDEISVKETELMKKIEKKWRDKSTREIVAFTHQQLPFEMSFEGEIIPYELITQEEPEYVY